MIGIWKVLQIFMLLKSQIVYGRLTGDHICLTKKSFLVNVTETHARNITVRQYQWCYNFPPRCSYYSVKQVKFSKIVTRNESRLVPDCCPSFVEKLDQCVSACSVCSNGVCENGYCNCLFGFKGETCDIDCGLEEWGPNCSRTCECSNKKCNSKTGACQEEETIGLETEMPETTTVLKRDPELVTEILKELVEKTKTSTTQNSISYSTIKAVSMPGKSASSPTTEVMFVTNNNTANNIIDITLITSTNIKDHTEPSTTTTVAIKYVETQTNNTTSTTFPKNPFTSIPIATKTGLLIPVEIQYDKLQTSLEDSENSQSNNTFVSNDENTFFANEFFLFALTIFVTFMFVLAILGINFLRRKKANENSSGKNNHRVAVFSTSIFHSPLPEPPVAENAVYFNSVMGESGLQEQESLKTRIVCNVIPLASNDMQKYEYDHPSSAGSYIDPSLFNPLEMKKHTSHEFVAEPVYDEIPQKEFDQNINVYVNTCGPTRF